MSHEIDVGAALKDLYHKHIELLDEFKNLYSMIERMHTRLCILENRHLGNEKEE